MIKRIGIFILILVVVGAILTYIFRSKIIARVLPKVTQIGDVHIKVKNDTSYINSDLLIENQTFIKIGIDTLKYKISLFNKTYLQSQKFIGISLEGHDKDTINFSLKIPYKAILNEIKIQRKKDDSASYEVVVSLQYSTFLGNSEIPINKSAKLKIPQPPEFKIIDIEWKRVRFKSIHAIAKIELSNHSPFELIIKKMQYSMDILKHGQLKGKHLEEITIKPNAKTLVSIPIEINSENIGKTIFETIINRDTYDYTLVLHATVESPDNFKDAFNLNLTNTGKVELKK